MTVTKNDHIVKWFGVDGLGEILTEIPVDPSKKEGPYFMTDYKNTTKVMEELKAAKGYLFQIALLSMKPTTEVPLLHFYGGDMSKKLDLSRSWFEKVRKELEDIGVIVRVRRGLYCINPNYFRYGTAPLRAMGYKFFNTLVDGDVVDTTILDGGDTELVAINPFDVKEYGDYRGR